jgi:hypothetical protein
MFLGLTNAEATACLRFIDPYGLTLFNPYQLPVLEAEIKARVSTIDPSVLRVHRKHRLDEAIRVGWQATVIETLRKDVEAASEAEDVQEVKAHMNQVLALIGRARSGGDHTYLRFMGD